MDIKDIVGGMSVVTTVNLLHVPVGTAGKIAKNKEGIKFGVSNETVMVDLGKGLVGSLYYNFSDLTPA